MVVEYRRVRSIQFISSRGPGPRSRGSKLNIWKTSFRSGEVEVSHTDWPRPDCFAAQSDEPSNRGCTAGVNFLMKGIKKIIYMACIYQPTQCRRNFLLYKYLQNSLRRILISTVMRYSFMGRPPRPAAAATDGKRTCKLCEETESASKRSARLDAGS